MSSSSGDWTAFCRQIESFLQADRIEMTIDGRRVRGYRSPDTPALWIRDHSDILRAGRYFESDVRSAVECFANAQRSNGRIYDYVTTFPEKRPCERENWEKWVRVPVEADVEYRFVKAVYLAWQATGDDTWVSTMLPSCERALGYTMSHPWRWDVENDLVKRPYTIDTWDFDYTAGRHPWLNFAVTDDTFWGITHSDNSGFYEAAFLLSNLYALTGNDEDVDRWRTIAEGVRRRANALLFNGRFYRHFHKLTPVSIDGVDEENQLSLSNPMAINRGLASHEAAIAILDEYQRRGEATQSFAPWFGIDPPFPDGAFGDDKLKGGAYINGGIFPLVGGELARAAFEHGYEQWGAQLLEQYRVMIERTGETYLWYFRDGTPSTVETSTSPEATPTDGWGSSAMLYAFIEGLCGVVDESHSFRKIQCAPRWAVTDEEEVRVEVSYEGSGSSFGYHYEHAHGGTINLRLYAPHAEVDLHVLVPGGCRPVDVRWDGSTVDFRSTTVENSTYADAGVVVREKADLEIRYVGP